MNNVFLLNIGIYHFCLLEYVFYVIKGKCWQVGFLTVFMCHPHIDGSTTRIRRCLRSRRRDDLVQICVDRSHL